MGERPNETYDMHEPLTKKLKSKWGGWIIGISLTSFCIGIWLSNFIWIDMGILNIYAVSFFISGLSIIYHTMAIKKS